MDADSPGEDRVTDSGGPQFKGAPERNHDIRVALEGGQAARQPMANLAVYNDKGQILSKFNRSARNVL